MRNACIPPWLLLPFPQHLLKPENVPVKSRSFYSKTRAAVSPLSSLDIVPHFPPKEKLGRHSPPAPAPAGLPPIWWVSCPSQACRWEKTAVAGPEERLKAGGPTKNSEG